MVPSSICTKRRRNSPTAWKEFPILMIILTSSAVVQSPDEPLVRPGGRGRPRSQVTPTRVHSLHCLPASEETTAEAVVPEVHVHIIQSKVSIQVT